MPLDEVIAKQIDFSSSPLRQIVDDIDELCRSIQRIGLLQPIIIRSKDNDRFEVVTGNRRLEACRRLRWRKIPCHVVELTVKESFEVSLIENLDRRSSTR